MVVPGTLSGQPAANTALRPMLVDCSPVCITQPITTSSMMPGSIPVRSISAFIVSAMRSTGCQSFNLPFRRPSGVRMASTMTALNMVSPKRSSTPSVCCVDHHENEFWFNTRVTKSRTKQSSATTTRRGLNQQGNPQCRCGIPVRG